MSILALLTSFIRSRPTITFDDLSILQAIAGQTVLCMEPMEGLVQEEKLQLAQELAEELLEEVGLAIPEPLIRTAIAAASYSLRMNAPAIRNEALASEAHSDLADLVESSQGRGGNASSTWGKP